MFGYVLATWGYVRLVRTWRERYAFASVFGFGVALMHDWPAYMWGAFFLSRSSSTASSFPSTAPAAAAPGVRPLLGGDGRRGGR